MSSLLVRADRRAALLGILLLTVVSGCATSAGMRRGHLAEQAQDFDRAVVEYTKLARANPASTDARMALERARLRAAQDHAVRGRRLAGLERYEEAVAEYQLASE